MTCRKITGCLLLLTALGCFGCRSSSGPATGNDIVAQDSVVSDSFQDVGVGGGETVSGRADSGFSDTTDVGTVRLCNGSATLCNKRFDEVTFAATHNAMSNEVDGWLAPNQTFPMKRQLEDGIRAMLIDTYFWGDEAMLCHGICELGSRPLVDALMELKVFLNDHPNEIVVLLIEDHLDVDKTVAVFNEAALTDQLYTHVPGMPWPTLGEMIDNDTRVVVSAESEGPPPQWYHHMWDLVFDTPYSFKTVADFNCDPNRGDPDNDLFLLNHWLSTPLPTRDGAKQVNQYDVLHARAIRCTEAFGRKPNFVAVDFYSEGDLFEVVRDLNRL